MKENPIVTFELNSGKKIVAELYPEIAPNTVNNFISLVKRGFYDGLIFHRVIPGFMIQGGDPEGTGMGGPGYGIRGEFRDNGFQNDLKHTAGVLSMARAMNPNSAGSTTMPPPTANTKEQPMTNNGRLERINIPHRMEMEKPSGTRPVTSPTSQSPAFVPCTNSFLALS